MRRSWFTGLLLWFVVLRSCCLVRFPVTVKRLVVLVLVVFVFLVIWIVSVVYIGLIEGGLIMARRKKLSLGRSKRMFTRGAQHVHPLNSGVLTGPGGPMRGGIRL